jgi:hypothetical protein
MALNLQARAAPNVGENDFSLEGILEAISIANPLGATIQTNFPVGGFFNIFGPATGFAYCLIIPDPNYLGTYQLKGPTTDTGVTVAGPCMFPVLPSGSGAVPTFGFTIPTAGIGFHWTFLFL